MNPQEQHNHKTALRALDDKLETVIEATTLVINETIDDFNRKHDQTGLQIAALESTLVDVDSRLRDEIATVAGMHNSFVLLTFWQRFKWLLLGQ